MARKSITELNALIASNLADNVNQSITPAILRSTLAAINEVFTPSQGRIKITTPKIVTLGTAFINIVGDSFESTGLVQYTDGGGLGSIFCDQKALTRVTFVASLSASQGRTISVALYIDGAVTTAVGSCVTQGATEQVSLTASTLLYMPAAANFELRARADTNNTSTTITNGYFLCESQPVLAFP